MRARIIYYIKDYYYHCARWLSDLDAILEHLLRGYKTSTIKTILVCWIKQILRAKREDKLKGDLHETGGAHSVVPFPLSIHTVIVVVLNKYIVALNSYCQRKTKAQLFTYSVSCIVCL